MSGSAVDRLPFMPDVPSMSVGATLGTRGVATAAGAGNRAMPGGGAPGSGGGFMFAPEEIDGVIARWEDLLERLVADRADIERLGDVRPPGKEFASGDFAEAGRTSGMTLGDQNQRMIDYVEKYIQALMSAKNAIVAQDENAQADIVTTAGDL